MNEQDLAELKGELKVLREQIAGGSITGALETIGVLEHKLDLVAERQQQSAPTPPPTVPEGNG